VGKKNLGITHACIYFCIIKGHSKTSDHGTHQYDRVFHSLYFSW
jgi:hypothetical protein